MMTHPEIIDGQQVGPAWPCRLHRLRQCGRAAGDQHSLPAARSGLPIAFQLVARYGADELLLSLAAQYERAHPWADRWPMLD